MRERGGGRERESDDIGVTGRREGVTGGGCRERGTASAGQKDTTMRKHRYRCSARFQHTLRVASTGRGAHFVPHSEDEVGQRERCARARANRWRRPWL